MMTVTARSGAIAGIAAAVVIALVYTTALSCGFINLDDPYYITNNSLIKSLDGASLLRIFTTPHLGTWLPLTYLSFAIDHHFWGLDPFGYHLTNVVLHAVNTMLVAFLAVQLCNGGRESVDGRDGANPAAGLLRYGLPLLAGVLWGLHPLRVESVAWAAERKDLLNGVFTLSAVLAYLRYARVKDAGGERVKQLGPYLAALTCFACSLMAKQVSVTLPLVLLLLDLYPLKRLNRKRAAAVVIEKIPFFAVSLAVTLLVIAIAAGEKLFVSAADMPLYVRVLVSGNAIFEYCRLSLLPVGISPYFVLPKPLTYGYAVKTAAAALMSMVLIFRARRFPAAFATWFAFVILLAPMLAFLHAGDDIALAARYTYLPAIAPSIAVAAGITAIAERFRSSGRKLLTALVWWSVIAYLTAATGMTLRLIGAWKDTGAFWSRVIEIEPVGRAYGDRGVYYLINGRSAEAADDFTTAIGIAGTTGLKSIYNLYAFRGVALSDVGRYAEAVADFDLAIVLYPHPTYFHYRGLALQALDRVAEAKRDFDRAGPNPPAIDWFERDGRAVSSGEHL